MKNLAENKDYEVKLEVNDTTYTARIQCCLCSIQIRLGNNMKTNKPMISNWTRHAVKCKKSDSSHATLDNYLAKPIELSSSVEHQQSNIDIADQTDSTTPTGFELALCAQSRQSSSFESVENDHHFRLTPP